MRSLVNGLCGDTHSSNRERGLKRMHPAAPPLRPAGPGPPPPPRLVQLHPDRRGRRRPPHARAAHSPTAAAAAAAGGGDSQALTVTTTANRGGPAGGGPGRLMDRDEVRESDGVCACVRWEGGVLTWPHPLTPCLFSLPRSPPGNPPLAPLLHGRRLADRPALGRSLGCPRPCRRRRRPRPRRRVQGGRRRAGAGAGDRGDRGRRRRGRAGADGGQACGRPQSCASMVGGRVWG